MKNLLKDLYNHKIMSKDESKAALISLTDGIRLLVSPAYRACRYSYIRSMLLMNGVSKKDKKSCKIQQQQ